MVEWYVPAMGDTYADLLTEAKQGFELDDLNDDEAVPVKGDLLVIEMITVEQQFYADGDLVTPTHTAVSGLWKVVD